MGRNLITISFVGPAKINPELKARAILHVAVVYEYIDQVKALIERCELEDLDFSDLYKNFITAYPEPDGIRNFLGNGNDPEDLEKLKWKDGKPETVVEDFLKLWGHEESYRDLNWQTFDLPTGEKWICHWAGDTTYGDSPDGDAYELFDAVVHLEFYKVLGLQ